MKQVRVGCSGWNYRDWHGSLYPADLPARRWLERYAQRFDTVEVNATFYRLATRATVERWVQQTPEDFCFAVKASRYLTHVRRLRDIEQSLHPLLRAAVSASGCRSPRRRSVAATGDLSPRRVRARSATRTPAGGRHAIERRHQSWFVEDVFALLRNHDVALVLGDHPQRPFQTHEATATWRYVRFHYGTRGRHGNYSNTELERWAKRLHRWRASHELLVYFNNDWDGCAPNNALWLQRRLAQLAA